MVTEHSIAAAHALLDGAVSDLSAMDDAALVGLQSALGDLARLVGRHSAATAGELARRSSPDLGQAGLAQTAGHRTPQAMIQAVTGISATDASRLVEVGSWEPASPLARGVSSGVVSVEGAAAIRRGLGSADASTSARSLDAVAFDLIERARGCTPEQLFRAARDARIRLDLTSIARREREQRDGRYLRVRQREDGMVVGSFALDQEAGRFLVSALDTLLSPRRGGPRFTDEAEQAAADRLLADPRTDDQIAADTLVDMIRLAVDADPGTLFGSQRPGVQVIVTLEQYVSGNGFGFIPGAPEPVSIDTARLRACSDGLVGILFSGAGQPLDVGRTQRFFTARQRAALAARDGGCRFPGCRRPPSWCEAHHIREWFRHEGRTDVADGILLCRHHHLLTHNHGWRITRDGADYSITPPIAVDPRQQSIAMPSHNPLLRELVVT